MNPHNYPQGEICLFPYYGQESRRSARIRYLPKITQQEKNGWVGISTKVHLSPKLLRFSLFQTSVHSEQEQLAEGENASLPHLLQNVPNVSLVSQAAVFSFPHLKIFGSFREAGHHGLAGRDRMWVNAGLRRKGLGSNPTYHLPDLGLVASPLWASILRL